MNPVEGVVRRVDRFQQTHRPLAIGFGVIKKFGDDRAGSLAALIAYYGFLAVFPLLLMLTTVLGFVMDRNSSLRASVLNSALRDSRSSANSLVRPSTPLLRRRAAHWAMSALTDRAMAPVRAASASENPVLSTIQATLRSRPLVMAT